MECVFKNAANFKGIIDILSNFTDNITFNITENGISIQAIDGSHISLVFIELFIDQFDKLVVSKSMLVSLSAVSLKPILKTMKDGDLVSMKVKDDSATVDITIIDGDRKNKYKLHQVYVDFELLNMDGINYGNMITSTKTGIVKILSDIKNTDAEEVSINIKDKNVVFNVQNDNVKLKIKPTTDIIKIAYNNSNDISMKFNTRYLMLIPKMLAVSKPKLSLFMDSETPFMMEVLLRADGEVKSADESVSNIRYYIAPKIDQ
jgi:proliferating cell nuclear antigen